MGPLAFGRANVAAGLRGLRAGVGFRSELEAMGLTLSMDTPTYELTSDGFQVAKIALSISGERLHGGEFTGEISVGIRNRPRGPDGLDVMNIVVATWQVVVVAGPRIYYGAECVVTTLEGAPNGCEQALGQAA